MYKALNTGRSIMFATADENVLIENILTKTLSNTIALSSLTPSLQQFPIN